MPTTRPSHSFNPLTLITLLALTLLPTSCTAQSFLHAKTQRNAQYPALELAKRAAAAAAATPDNVVLGNQGIINGLGLYSVNLSVGTPAQHVMLQLDTGSSDLWMFGPASCDATTSLCWGGVYDSQKSSSAAFFSDAIPFSIQYETKGSGVEGIYLQDTVVIGKATLTSMIVAQATAASYVASGICGIDYDTFESAAESGAIDKPYPNIIDEMLSQGVIERRAYSLWLDDLQETTGNIVFGGVDSGKYLGDLAVLPLQEDENTGIVDSFSVVVAGMSLTTSTGTVALSSPDFPFTGVLDSGTTNTIIPDDLWQQLATTFNVVNDTTNGIFIIDCDIGSNPGTVDFQFGGAGGPVISIPFSELALPLFNFTTGQQVLTQAGKPYCHFGLVSDAEGYDILLGDTLLRSAYVVYDLDGAQAYIAQTNFDSKASNIVAIGADGSFGAAQAGGGSGSGSSIGASASASSYATETLKVSNTGSALNTANGASVTAVGVGASTTPTASVTKTGLNTVALTGASSVAGFSHPTNAPSAAISSASAAAAASASATAKSGAGSLKMEVRDGLGLRWVVGGVMAVVLAKGLGLVEV